MKPTNAAAVATPMLDKMLAVKDHSQAIGEFLDWLATERGIVLATRHQHMPIDDDDLPDEAEEYDVHGCYEYRSDTASAILDKKNLGWRLECGFINGALVSILPGTEQLLADYFEIDLVAVEREKLALLDAIRLP